MDSLVQSTSHNHYESMSTGVFTGTCVLRAYLQSYTISPIIDFQLCLYKYCFSSRTNKFQVIALELIAFENRGFTVQYISKKQYIINMLKQQM